MDYVNTRSQFRLLEFKPPGGKPDEIIVKGKNHQEDDENQADLLGDLHLS